MRAEIKPNEDSFFPYEPTAHKLRVKEFTSDAPTNVVKVDLTTGIWCDQCADSLTQQIYLHHLPEIDIFEFFKDKGYTNLKLKYFKITNISKYTITIDYEVI